MASAPPRRGAKLGGVGCGLTPKTALPLGLKVDADALAPDLVTAIKAGKIGLTLAVVVDHYNTISSWMSTRSSRRQT